MVGEIGDQVVENDHNIEECSFTYTRDGHGQNVFRELQDMRGRGEQIDCVLHGDGGGSPGISCHRLVLSSVSPYFRAMFRHQEENKDVTLHGIEENILETMINFFYTGQLTVRLDLVCSLLSAGDILLCDWVVDKCQTFLLDNLHLDNVVMAARLSGMYRLSQLDKAARRFCEAEFKNIVGSEEWEQFQEKEVVSLLESDGLVADEDFVCDSVLRWLELTKSGTETVARLTSLLRFPLCSPTYLQNIEDIDSYHVIRDSEPYKLFKSDKQKSVTNYLQREVRCRGTNDLLLIQHDGSETLYCYDTEKERWMDIFEIPFGAGSEYAGLAGRNGNLYLVGGRSKEGVSLRSVFCLNIDSRTWSRMSDMKEVRWYHGAVVVGSRLYAVAGCGQLNSVEYLELDHDKGVANNWQMVSPMNVSRHLPGVGCMSGNIYVCGGTDDTWAAYSTVECLIPATGDWIRLPDMCVPRVQPAVICYQDKLYVMGGRNSNKVELKSAEIFDPINNRWEMVKEMHRKRWGPAAAVFHKKIVVIGGRGKRAGKTAEVFSPEDDSWTIMAGEIPCQDRSYSACLVQKPWNWTYDKALE